MDYRFVLLARRLNVPAYLEAAGITEKGAGHFPRHTIVCEPPGRAWCELIEASGSDLYELPGRISLSPDSVSYGIPAGLTEALSKQSTWLGGVLHRRPTWLVVHSGPREEIETLVEMAKTDIAGCKDGRIVAIVPREEEYPGVASYRFFPASLLYPYVHRIVTGAGYNCIAETGPWREKHLCRAFPRRYDEQEERLAELLQTPVPDFVNGAPFAARHIASLL